MRLFRGRGRSRLILRLARRLIGISGRIGRREGLHIYFYDDAVTVAG